MKNGIPRMRVFAGPNGSGKSTIKSVLNPELLGIYINPDEIEKEIGKGDFLDFQAYEVVSRYRRSLDLLAKAIPFTNRAYIFDNSGHEHLWLAEITDGRELEIKTDHIPKWFKEALLDKLRFE